MLVVLLPLFLGGCVAEHDFKTDQKEWSLGYSKPVGSGDGKAKDSDHGGKDYQGEDPDAGKDPFRK